MSNTTKTTKTTRKPSETAKQPKARGILPNDQWLKANGYAGLLNAMKRNPELFSHIRQEA